MTDWSMVEPMNGLLGRAAFISELQAAQSAGTRVPCVGSLLIIRISTWPGLPDHQRKSVLEGALRHALLLLQTRWRSRDLAGRLSHNVLGLFLRQCRVNDARSLADHYASRLNRLELDLTDHVTGVHVRYRVVSLDSFVRPLRQPEGSPPPDADTSQAQGQPDHPRIQPFETALEEIAGKKATADAAADKHPAGKDAGGKNASGKNTGGKDTGGKIVRLSSAYRSRDESGPETGFETGSVVRLPANDQVEEPKPGQWRLRPGVLIRRSSLICCYRLQPVGFDPQMESIQGSAVFMDVLNALSVTEHSMHPALQSQIVLPVSTQQLDTHLPAWVTGQCQKLRVSPSDICFSLSVGMSAQDQRHCLPILRQLNRRGLRLMLEGACTQAQFRSLQKLAHFDYLHISSRLFNDTVSNRSAFRELRALIGTASDKHCEICASGIDNEAMVKHALALGVEIGFGRACGRSVPFPVV